jgi:protein phosphatase
MGTTLITAMIRGDRIYFANVGDSRVYLCRESGFWQLTEDHSLVNEQLKAGLIKSESDLAYSKNVITRSVGFEKSIHCDIIERQITPGDQYLICTDGLTGMVQDRELYEILRKNEKATIVGRLIEDAKQNGGLDNVTVMLIDVTSDSEK